MAQLDRDIDLEANGIASDLVRVLYQNNFEALVSTLNRFHVPERCYSLFFIRDESTCLINEDGIWKVFFSERGIRTNVKISSDVEEACQHVLYEMAESMDEYKTMQDYYQIEMGNLAAVKTTYKDIVNAVKESLRKVSSVAAAL